MIKKKHLKKVLLNIVPNSFFIIKELCAKHWLWIIKEQYYLESK